MNFPKNRFFDIFFVRGNNEKKVKTESRFSYGVVELTGGWGQKKRGRTLKVP